MASKVQRHLSYAAQKSNTHNSGSMTWGFLAWKATSIIETITSCRRAQTLTWTIQNIRQHIHMELSHINLHAMLGKHTKYQGHRKVWKSGGSSIFGGHNLGWDSVNWYAKNLGVSWQLRHPQGRHLCVYISARYVSSDLQSYEFSKGTSPP